jgi:uncharacterized protein (TIGR03435 family)
MRRPGKIALAAPIVAGIMYAAQSVPAAAPKFEVASIKPSQRGRAGGVRLDGALFTSSGIPLRNLIYSAYGVPAWTVSGGPAWLDTDAYDIAATLPPGAPKEQINAMLQELLAERFKLKIHREMRDYSVYALVVAKDGPKLKASADGKSGFKTGRGHLEIYRASMPFSSVTCGARTQRTVRCWI